MIATETSTTGTITATRFGRIVAALAASYVRLVVGREWSFGIGPDHDIVLRVPAAGRLALTLHELDADGDHGRALRTVIVQPGVYRALDVISDAVVIGEAHLTEAAFSTALEYVTAPLRARQQHEHDAFAV